MYDPMIAKLIVWDTDRERATQRMLRALGEYSVGGLTTLIPFHEAILVTEQWSKGETCRDLLADAGWLEAIGSSAEEGADAGASAEELVPSADHEEREYQVEVDGRLLSVKVIGEAVSGRGAGEAELRRPPRRSNTGAASDSGGATKTLSSPIQGTVLKVAITHGAEVVAGELICVVEAMKMENEVTAHRAGTVTDLNVTEGDAIGTGDVIAVIE